MIDMKKQYLGIDLGTSAVKLLLVTADGVVGRAKCRYETANVGGWCAALKEAVEMLKKDTVLTDIAAVCLSSQVGTFITDTGEVIGWSSSVGGEELREIQAAVTDDEWVCEIGMVHPALISYPLPRLLHIKQQFPRCTAVMMPKELLVQELTGETVSDIFSWRGLCHPDKAAYSKTLLQKFGIDLALPKLLQPTEKAGYITPSACEKYGLPAGVPVYVGCNDFFAGLLGMGVLDEGTVFELSGTSEHLGVITACRKNGAVVSGRYFNGYATYGGTKSSGVSCDFAIKQFGIDGIDTDTIYHCPPIFLPYLKGERAPIYDENAKGVFFGITDKTSDNDMAYAVLEGVVFSLYHIGETLGLEDVPYMMTGGGSAVDTLMAKLKAALFDCDILRVVENDSSALGAAMLAMVGEGAFVAVEDAVKTVVRYEKMASPDKVLRMQLLKRYGIYERLYKNLVEEFKEFSKLKGED